MPEAVIGNFVHRDEIWKCHVKGETKNKSDWPHSWGFLTKKYEELRKNTEDSYRKQYKNSLRHKKTTYGKCFGNEERGFLPTIKNTTSPISKSISFPKTSLSTIGWISNPLEIYGSYSRGKNSTERTLGWPREGI